MRSCGPVVVSSFSLTRAPWFVVGVLIQPWVSDVASHQWRPTSETVPTVSETVEEKSPPAVVHAVVEVALFQVAVVSPKSLFRPCSS